MPGLVVAVSISSSVAFRFKACVPGVGNQPNTCIDERRNDYRDCPLEPPGP